MFVGRILSIWMVAAALPAQTTTSTLAGSVTDASGAAVTGAQIQVINEASGVAVPAQTNAAGLYHVVGLSPGTYRVEVAAAGFQKLARSGVSVAISQTLQLDLALQVGNVQESISITASAPLLEAQSSTVGQLVE